VTIWNNLLIENPGDGKMIDTGYVPIPFAFGGERTSNIIREHHRI
jgi:hypothetical protein